MSEEQGRLHDDLSGLFSEISAIYDEDVLPGVSTQEVSDALVVRSNRIIAICETISNGTHNFQCHLEACRHKRNALMAKLVAGYDAALIAEVQSLTEFLRSAESS